MDSLTFWGEPELWLFGKEFRIHDYFLGRANCEKFLRDRFTVPVDAITFKSQNAIFDEGYHHIADKERYTSLTDAGKSLQIIPIFT